MVYDVVCSICGWPIRDSFCKPGCKCGDGVKIGFVDKYERDQAFRYGTFKTVTGEVEAASPMNIAVDWKLRGF